MKYLESAGSGGISVGHMIVMLYGGNFGLETFAENRRLNGIKISCGYTFIFNVLKLFGYIFYQ